MMKFLILLSLVFTFSAVAQVSQNRSAPAQRKTVIVKSATRKNLEKSKIRQNLKVGLVAWSDNVELKTSDGRVEDVNVSMNGLSLDYSYSYYKDTEYEYFFGAKGFYLDSKAVAKGTSITYKNSGDKVAVISVYATGLYFPAKNVSVGLGLAALTYKLNLPKPTSNLVTYEFNYSPALQVLYHIELNWYFDQSWYLNQTLFSSLNGPHVGAGWNIALGVLF